MELKQNEIEIPKNIFKSLYFQVLVGILIGGIIGYFYPAIGKSMKPLGDGFVKMVKMIISPVIFITIASGIGRMNSLKGFGKTTIFAFSYFFIFSTLALLLGIFVANAFSPGTGMNAVLSPIDSQRVAEYSQKAHAFTTTEFLLDIIPKSFLSAFVDGNILQTLFVAVVFGISLVVSGEKGKPIVDLLDNIAQPMFRMVDILMHFAPIGAFGAIAFTVGMFGIDSIKRLLFLIGSFYFTAAFFVLVILGAVGKLTGFSIFRLINYLKSEILLVLGTSSSEAALPSLMEKLEGAGCKRETVGLVVPSGYSFNLDGTNIYLTLAALFIAQATNTHLTAAQQIALFSVAIVSSKGAAGVTGAGLITLAATLQVVPTVPLAGMALIVGVDRFMSECRAITNFIGNAVATIVVSKLQGELDYSKLDFAMRTGKPMYQGAPFTQTLSLTSGVKIGEKDTD